MWHSLPLPDRQKKKWADSLTYTEGLVMCILVLWKDLQLKKTKKPGEANPYLKGINI